MGPGAFLLGSADARRAARDVRLSPECLTQTFRSQTSTSLAYEICHPFFAYLGTWHQWIGHPKSFYAVSTRLPSTRGYMYSASCTFLFAQFTLADAAEDMM